MALHIAAEISDLILRSIIADKETDENDWFAIGNLLLVYNSAIIRLFFETIVSQCNVGCAYHGSFMLALTLRE